MPTPELVGILNINKPSGWTSHDVVARVRRLAAQRRVGHPGTLDPMATGVLPVLLGRATRLADFIHAYSKTYVAEVRLGIATSTDDAEGTVTSMSEVPGADPEPVLAQFHGEIEQTPPAFSAIKVQGQRAYAAARQGRTLTLQPRQVVIHDLKLLKAEAETLTLEVTCSTGTYIRALARDIAHALGTVGHLTSLTRTRVGPFCLTDSIPVETLADIPPSVVLPPDAAFADSLRYEADPEATRRLLNGQPIAAHGLHADVVRVYDPDGRILCIATANGTILRPRIAL
jgi:tRNA pseudouridine55 synthase